MLMRITAVLATGLAVAGATTPPPSGSQLGLFCAGHEELYGKDGPWERTFSLDLAGGRGWVVGAEGQFDVVATPTRISFWKAYEIDRSTGRLTGRSLDPLYRSFVVADCKAVPYKPIPEKKF